MALYPTSNNVLVTPLDSGATETNGGLIIADVALSKTMQGIIVIAAPYRGKFLAGDRVFFNRHDAVEIIEEGVVYLCVNEENIFAYFRNGPAIIA